MMKSLLLLKHLKVENANAISGLTYGFPAISHFLGFTHLLSRRLQQHCRLSLAGCAVISHQVQLQSHRLGNRGEQVFSLTRNPLTKEGSTAPFNEEGKVHLDISLLIECEFTADDLPGNDSPLDAQHTLEQWVMTQIATMRLAGGIITQIGKVCWSEQLDSLSLRKLAMGLLPGYALICRNEVLSAHHEARCQQDDTQPELLDSLLDFVTLTSQSVTEGTSVVWQYQSKPDSGFWVPLAVGYQAISPLYPPGTVTAARDSTTPFCFAEAIYTLGQWISPHRINNLAEIFWHYHQQDDLYLCENHYYPSPLAPEEDEEDDYIS